MKLASGSSPTRVPVFGRLKHNLQRPGPNQSSRRQTFTHCSRIKLAHQRYSPAQSLCSVASVRPSRHPFIFSAIFATIKYLTEELEVISGAFTFALIGWARLSSRKKTSLRMDPLTDRPCRVTQRFPPDGRGLFQDDPAHRAGLRKGQGTDVSLIGEFFHSFTA